MDHSGYQAAEGSILDYPETSPSKSKGTGSRSRITYAAAGLLVGCLVCTLFVSLQSEGIDNVIREQDDHDEMSKAHPKDTQVPELLQEPKDSEPLDFEDDVHALHTGIKSIMDKHKVPHRTDRTPEEHNRVLKDFMVQMVMGDTTKREMTGTEAVGLRCLQGAITASPGTFCRKSSCPPDYPYSAGGYTLGNWKIPWAKPTCFKTPSQDACQPGDSWHDTSKQTYYDPNFKDNKKSHGKAVNCFPPCNEDEIPVKAVTDPKRTNHGSPWKDTPWHVQIDYATGDYCVKKAKLKELAPPYSVYGNRVGRLYGGPLTVNGCWGCPCCPKELKIKTPAQQKMVKDGAWAANYYKKKIEKRSKKAIALAQSAQSADQRRPDKCFKVPVDSHDKTKVFDCMSKEESTLPKLVGWISGPEDWRMVIEKAGVRDRNVYDAPHIEEPSGQTDKCRDARRTVWVKSGTRIITKKEAPYVSGTCDLKCKFSGQTVDSMEDCKPFGVDGCAPKATGACKAQWAEKIIEIGMMIVSTAVFIGSLGTSSFAVSLINAIKNLFKRVGTKLIKTAAGRAAQATVKAGLKNFAAGAVKSGFASFSKRSLTGFKTFAKKVVLTAKKSRAYRAGQAIEKANVKVNGAIDEVTEGVNEAVGLHKTRWDAKSRTRVVTDKTKWRKKLTDQLQGAMRENSAAMICANTMTTVFQSMETKTAKKRGQAIGSLNWDPTGLTGVIKNCGSPAKASCTADIVGALSAFDPTGILGVVAVFMHPVCEGSVGPSLA